MVTGSGAAMGIRYQVILEATGKCLVNEKKEYYTRLSKVTKKVVIFLGILLYIVPIFGLLYLINFVPEEFTEGEISFFKILLLLMIPAIVIIIRAGRPFLFDKWTITKNSLLIKKTFKTIEIPLQELKEVSMTMIPIENKGFVVLTSKEFLIRIPYAQAMGGIDFLMKLKNLIGIPMIDEERLKKNVSEFKPITLKEEKKEYKRRKAMGMKVI